MPTLRPSPDPAGRDTVDDPRGHAALLLLSAASGAADAFVFICVGQVFAGVMTGNLVLLGASAAGAGEEEWRCAWSRRSSRTAAGWPGVR